ncbi:hypothetical protein OIB37_02200 [Streptomyces sp. NBC_00820]|uniref:hypothetical protein n=1 Tax=Streptomyces sp. NBC_00820 TaxID=2975842 RepID=UPI002ED592DC|nr:hypothetical protein OIB37_02200 [Streptomyces sp. NBC_00820]
MTEPASAAAQHIIVLQGKIGARDGADVWGGHSVTKESPFRETFVLTHNDRQWKKTFKVCAGNEARAVLYVRAYLRDDEQVYVRPNVWLYEGHDCDSSDLDANVWPASQVMPGGRGSRSWQIWLPSEEENLGVRDAAYADVTFTHALFP